MRSPFGVSPRGDVHGQRTSTRSVLASVVARFAREWETASAPPDLSAHLPDVPALRRISLIELIKVDLAYRWWRNDDPQRLAAYCAEFPELADQPLPPDLIIEEFRCMRQTGLVGPGHFAEEFPDQERGAEALAERWRQPEHSDRPAPGAGRA